MFKGILSECNKIIHVFKSLIRCTFECRRCFVGWVLHIVISAMKTNFGIPNCLGYYVISLINSII